MTGGGDLDEILDDEGPDPGKEVDPADGGLLAIDENDTDPSAGGSDIGGRAGDSDS